MGSAEALVYLETSAAAKLLVEEAESAMLAAWLDDRVAQGVTVLSSLLLETELRRLAVRTGLVQERVSHLLDRIDLVELDAPTCRTAGLLDGPRLRSLDALHVAAALRADCQTMISYDGRQADAARMVGLHVVAPQ